MPSYLEHITAEDPPEHGVVCLWGLQDNRWRRLISKAIEDDGQEKLHDQMIVMQRVYGAQFTELKVCVDPLTENIEQRLKAAAENLDSNDCEIQALWDVVDAMGALLTPIQMRQLLRDEKMQKLLDGSAEYAPF